jgi:hypothetical protein
MNKLSDATKHLIGISLDYFNNNEYLAGVWDTNHVDNSRYRFNNL